MRICDRFKKIPKSYEWVPEPDYPTPIKVPIYLNRIERIILALGGAILIGDYKASFRDNDLPYYLGWCDEHGLYVTYRQGLDNRLECVICQTQRLGNHETTP